MQKYSELTELVYGRPEESDRPARKRVSPWGKGAIVHPPRILALFELTAVDHC